MFAAPAVAMVIVRGWIFGILPSSHIEFEESSVLQIMLELLAQGVAFAESCTPSWNTILLAHHASAALLLWVLTWACVRRLFPTYFISVTWYSLFFAEFNSIDRYCMLNLCLNVFIKVLVKRAAFSISSIAHKYAFSCLLLVGDCVAVFFSRSASG